MKKTLMILVAAALLTAPALMAQQGNCDGNGPGRGFGDGYGRHMGLGGDFDGRGGRGMGMLLAHAEELGLTDQQVSALEDMRSEFQLAQVDRKAELKKAEIKLKDLMRDEAPQSQILSQMDKIGVMKTEMKKVQYQHREAVKNVLTAEQQEKMKDFRKDFGKRSRGNGSGPGNRGQGRRGQGMGRGL